MNKLIRYFSKKGLAKNLLLSLSVACVAVSALSYALYYSNSYRILENRLKLQTKSQILLNNQNMAKTFETLDMISDNLLNSLYQYDISNPLSYITRLNELSDLGDTEAIRFANYTLNVLDFYIGNYPVLDSIFLYTRDGTVISSSGTNTRTQVQNAEFSDFMLDSVIAQFDESNTSFQWLGSYKIKDFVLGNSRSRYNQDSESVFTGMRRLTNHITSQDAFLVFCLRQDALRDIYYTYPITADIGSVFLVDDSGKIHFSNREETIGTQSRYAEYLKEKDRFVSFTVKNNHQKTNIFYQSLDNTDLYVLYEIPANAYASDIVFIRNMSLVLFVCTVLLLSAAVLYVVTRKLKPLQELTRAAAYIGSGNLGYTIPLSECSEDEIGILAENFNLMSRNLLEMMSQKEQAEEQKRLQEIAALQAQINPHFILNTINTVKWMAIINHSPNISECLTAFGKILEPLLKFQTSFYKIEDELSYLENYVTIMNYSHGNTIQMRCSVPEELLKCKIPRFILQPLVENAVLHSADKDTNKVEVEIEMEAVRDNINIVVLSHGATIERGRLLAIQKSLLDDSVSLGTSSIGLANINRRIHAFYGEAFGIWIENSSASRVKVTVIIPKEIFS